MEFEDYLTIPEAVRMLGVTQAAVRIAVSNNRLDTITKYGRKLVHVDVLAAYKDRTQPNGVKVKNRPPGSRNRPKSGGGSDEAGGGA